MDFPIPKLVLSDRPRQGRDDCQQGFTLVELLVVIAVITILASMLVPALAPAKTRGKESRCLNNTRQLSLAMFMYTADAGKMPAYSSPAYSHGVWMGTLIDYYGKTDGIRLCPSASATNSPPSVNYGASNGDSGTADRAWWRPASTPSGAKKIFSGSYGLNGWLYSELAARAKAEHPEYAFLKESDILKPTLTPVFMDSIWVDLWPYATDLPSRDLYNGSYQPSGMGRITISRHGPNNPATAPRNFTAARLPGAINVSFADGRAETVDLEKLWNFTWHAGYIVPRNHPQ